MVNVALVGTGFIAKVHAESIKKLPNAKLTAVVSGSREKGESFAKEYGAKVYSNLETLLKEGDADAIDICAPTFLHAEMAVSAAAAGKHILCEKPIALSLKDADTMIKAAEKNNVQAMVGHTMRFWPEYVKAKEIIDGGELGKPVSAFCERLAAAPDWHKGSWGFDEKKSGGASVDLHIHDLDFLVWIFGKPQSVSALGAYKKSLGGFYHINTCVEFSGGASASAIGGWGFSGSFPFTMSFRILCEKGTLEWLFRAGKNIEERSQKSKLTVYKQDGSTYAPDVPEEDAYFKECKYFVDRIDNNKTIKIATFKDAKKALQLALLATEAARKKKTLSV